ncbi:cytochrome P450 [Suillus lakei]|nr:cytochrome P450 [Suillus lakei]
MLTNLLVHTACAIVVTIALLLALIIARHGVPCSSFPCPPGPKPLPVIGNVVHISISEIQHGIRYTVGLQTGGGLIRVRLMGLEVVVINSEKTARVMLDQQSVIYSDRPVLATNKFHGVECNTVMLRYVSELRSHKKIFHHALQTESSLREREIYLRRARTLLASLLDDQGFEAHIQGLVIMRDILSSENDPYVSAVTKLVEILTNGQTPERAAILSAFPFLAHIPAWFPGAKFKRDALHSRKLAQKVLDAPFEFTKLEIVAGIAPQSMVSDCLARIDKRDDREAQEFAIKSAAATAYIEIIQIQSSSMLHAFILAMVLYPEVQARAHSEIDTVVGSTRLPCFEDRPSLPYYVEAIIEMLRWNPVIPLGMYHHIKRTWVIINHWYVVCPFRSKWAMSRDEEKYPDPDGFRPGSHIGSDGSLIADSITNSSIFGFGRRICPGRFTAESMLWAAIVSILATFRIEKAKGVDGREIEVRSRFTTGMAMFVDDVDLSGFVTSSTLQTPRPFPLRICVSFCAKGEVGQRRHLTNP